MARDINLTIKVKQIPEPEDSLYAFKMKVEVKDNYTEDLYEIEVPYGSGQSCLEGKRAFVDLTKEIEKVAWGYIING